MSTPAAVLAAVLLLPGCMTWRGPHHAATADERAAVDAAITSWVAAGRRAPEGDLCAPLERVEIVTVEAPPAGRSPCVVLEQGGGRSWAPACSRYVEPYVGAPSRLAIYLDASLDDAGRRVGIVHESLHAIRGCVVLTILDAGEPAPAWRGEDRGDDDQHLDEELWGAIQSAALAGLGR